MDDSNSKDSKSGNNVMWLGVAFICLMIFTAAGTLLIARAFFTQQLCPGNALPQNLRFQKTAEWQTADRTELPDKNLVVVVPEVDEHCYLIPAPKFEVVKRGVPRPMQLINQSLSLDLVKELAGIEAVGICEGRETYLVRELKEEELLEGRQKRQATTKNPDMQGLDLSYEERSPRCVDLILDCSLEGSIGQVQTCYTWVNGILRMHQTCEAPNKFKIGMTKPPGRILKIMQKQMIECIVRRRKGLYC